jgi:hypothetical protein
MGSIMAIDCVKLEDLSHDIFTQYESDYYTVIKSDHSIESGWRLSRVPHRCIHNREGWQAAHAVQDSEWRVFLYHDTFPNLDTHTPLDPIYYMGPDFVEHSCGWRRVSRFWPTRLNAADESERTRWQTQLIAHLGSLQQKG